ncbi:MAG: hypothetical protein HN337_04680, partial [Deltaproteobacteria bacterium]|nr:hypothetical protein [Deltaproteobacteria bacterium]
MIIPEDLNKAFKVYITERSGLYFKDHNLADLQTAIQERMKSKRVDSVPAYYTLLTISDNREDETRELINLLTIKHTYFFRNEPHFKALKENILPGIVERRAVPGEESDLGKPAIRIWSAGCSTGAEPYSIAMLLREIIPNMDDWDIQIIATDASTNALDTARRGRYRDTYLKNVDSEYLKKYFTLKSERGGHREYEVNDDIKGLVSFANHNLMEDQYPMNFDIILCRNVVIYFELKTTISVMDKICTSLNDDGYLFVGYSESLNYLSDKFKMESIGDAIVYRKSMVTAAPNISSVQSTETNLQMILEDVSKKEVEAKMEVEFQKISTFEKSYEELLVQATTCFHLKEYDKALVFIEEALSIDRTAADPHYLAAEVYMNQGEFDEDEIGEGVSINAFEKKTLARVKKDGYSCFHVKVNLDEECVLKSVRAFMVFRKLHEIGEVIKSYPNSEMIENEKFDLQFSCIFITREGSLLVKKKAMEVLEVSDVTIDDIPVDELWDKEGEQKAIAPIQEIEGAAPAHIEQLRKIRSVRVDIEQLDKMMNLVEELAINKLRLMDVGSRFPDADLKIIIEGLSRITDNLQTEVMEARLVPVAQIFDRFPRLVRDLARKQDKQIRIDIIGGDIELDRTVLDEIGDPLIHLIRNAVDHGVGTVEKRKALGKSVEGRIMLSAVREKGHILISVADDGDGMDIERIKNVALKRGVVSNDELASMNDEDIKMLVTRPGF